jgi:hypothetical protein
MRIAEENWKVLASLCPAGWKQMAWRSGSDLNRVPDVLGAVAKTHWLPADPCHTTVRTGPYTAVRVGYANNHRSELEARAI